MPLVVHGVDRLEVPFLADQPVVALLKRAIGRVKIIICFEQPAVLQVFVGPADLLTDEPAEIP
jgi:hypothetical protein